MRAKSRCAGLINRLLSPVTTDGTSSTADLKLWTHSSPILLVPLCSTTLSVCQFAGQPNFAHCLARDVVGYLRRSKNELVRLRVSEM